MQSPYFTWINIAALCLALGCGRGGFEQVSIDPQYRVGDSCDAPINISTQCGVGACVGTHGQMNCVDGVVVDTCDPKALAAPHDASCNDIDDDCDGSTDEDYVETPTVCGVGACVNSNIGVLACIQGTLTDTCNPLAPPATNDATCNNIDDDCDGSTDEDYVATSTVCGVGACAGNTGVLTCQGGTTVDTCDPFAGATTEGPDPTCRDGIDNDCDGNTDAQESQCVPVQELTPGFPAGRDVRAFRYTADGSHMVYIADRDTSDVFELFAVNLATATSTKLNGNFSPDRDVLEFDIAPISNRVIYRADQDTNDIFELYSVPITGGATQKLHPPLAATQLIRRYAITAADRVIYLADVDTPNKNELYAVDVDGTNTTKLNIALGASEYVSEFAVSQNSQRIIYDAGTIVSLQAYVVNPDGTNSMLLHAPFIAGQTLDFSDANLRSSADSSKVIYKADVDTGATNRFDIHMVNMDGTNGINLSQLTTGEATSGVLTTNASHLVFADNISGTGIVDLYSVQNNGTNKTKLHRNRLVGESAGSFLITPNGQKVIYELRDVTSDTLDLFSVNVSGTGNVRLNTNTLGATGVSSFAVTADSTRVVYLANQDDTDLRELYSVNVDGTNRRKLNQTLVPGGGVETFILADAASAVLFLADAEIDGVTELYVVPIDGSAPPQRVNDGLASGGDVIDFLVSPNGLGVVYLADAKTNDALQLFHKDDFRVPGVGASAASAPQTLVNSGLVARYYLNEASGGTTPGQVLDSAPAPLSLNISSIGNVGYTTGGAGRGLEWLVNDAEGSAIVGIDGTKLKTALHGATTCTLEAVVEVDVASHSAPRLIWFGQGSQSGVLSLHYFGKQELHFYFDANNGYQPMNFPVRLEDRGRVVVTVVVDTNQAVPLNRVRLYLDGAPLNPHVRDSSVPEQFRTFDMGTGNDFRIGNRDFSERSINGKIYYVAIYSQALSATDVRRNAEVLLNSDDPP
ncbi:MAG: LamG-like jellyroll fold domain-containing protein [Myxococcota bacterium]